MDLSLAKIHHPPNKEHEMANTKKATAKALDAELSEKDYITAEILGDTYRLHKRFKRLKFLRKLSSDPMAALELIFFPGDLERLEDKDMSEDDMGKVFDAVSEALAGGPKG